MMSVGEGSGWGAGVSSALLLSEGTEGRLRRSMPFPRPPHPCTSPPSHINNINNNGVLSKYRSRLPTTTPRRIEG
jgi:hypothetical protein